MNAATENAADTEPVAPVGFIGRDLTAKTSRNEQLDSLLRSIDATLLVLFAISYYCDNLTFLLVIRASSQALYARANQLAPIVVANILCILTHILHAQPEGTAALRNYLHGGLICDFIGELGPISRTRLLLMDLIVLCLQLIYLAISHELDVLTGVGVSTLPQDLESEEAGVRRQEQDTTASTSAEEGADGIDLQPMLPNAAESSKSKDAGTGPDKLILTLDIRKSLSGLLKKNRSVPPADSNAGRLNVLYERVMAARAAAARA
jgi:hypothetical protein